MATYGYARVSTEDQSLDIQHEALVKAGCSVIRKEHASGNSRDGRRELETLLDFLQPGDTLVVTRIDRLARSMLDFQMIVAEIRRKGANLRCTEQPIADTEGALGGLMMDVLAAFAVFETKLRRERQMEGIRRAVAAGKFRGGKTRVNAERVRELWHQGMGPSAIARELKFGRATIYRALGDLTAGRALNGHKAKAPIAG